MRINVITFASLLAATSAAIPAYGAPEVTINKNETFEKLDKSDTTYRVGNNGILTVNGDANINALINNNYPDGGQNRGTIGGGCY